jgi:hypothetical protein
MDSPVCVTGGNLKTSDNWNIIEVQAEYGMCALTLFGANSNINEGVRKFKMKLGHGAKHMKVFVGQKYQTLAEQRRSSTKAGNLVHCHRIFQYIARSLEILCGVKPSCFLFHSQQCQIFKILPIYLVLWLSLGISAFIHSSDILQDLVILSNANLTLALSFVYMSHLFYLLIGSLCILYQPECHDKTSHKLYCVLGVRT